MIMEITSAEVHVLITALEFAIDRMETHIENNPENEDYLRSLREVWYQQLIVLRKQTL